MNQLEKQIERNREEINSLLHKDIPLDLLYMRIRMLSAQNEKLIQKTCTVKK